MGNIHSYHWFPQEKPLGDFPAQVKDRFTPGAMPAADLKPVGQVELQRYTAIFWEWKVHGQGFRKVHQMVGIWMGICLG